jgi:hypothetical protein
MAGSAALAAIASFRESKSTRFHYSPVNNRFFSPTLFKEGCWKCLPSACREESLLANTFIARRNCGGANEVAAP